ncbi:MAG: QueT transporter family protein, partial [Acholeplasmatales bacterium]|nr:QueT transporter family protein [Acholeplasmatales bacterium]
MNFTIKDLIKQALIAAIYLVLVIIFWEFSFKEIQFRIAEILLILIFFDKKSIIGLTLGVII